MLDNQKLISLVSRWPALWNRNDKRYLDYNYKALLWSQIAHEMNTTVSKCKETFNSLEEQYMKDKEKAFSNHCEFQNLMHFLDIDGASQTDYRESCKQSMILKSDPYSTDDYEEGPSSESETGSQDSGRYNLLDFSRALIQLVHNSPALWDRSCKDHHDKVAKDLIWKNISKSLKTDVSTCTLRWKGLREKYIRQKQKYNDGLGKWELLDDLSFLDSVILYRKRQWQSDELNAYSNASENSCNMSHLNADSNCDSSPVVNFHNNQIFQNQSQQATPAATLRPNVPPDSTDNNSVRGIDVKRLRNNSETIEKEETKPRSPEQIFGELVAAMLASKPEKEKQAAMMEIMAVLAR